MTILQNKRVKPLSASILAFGLLAGGVALGATPAFAVEGEDLLLTPSVTTDKSEYAVTDVVGYQGQNFFEGDVEVIVSGPISGSFYNFANEAGFVEGTLQIEETIDDVPTGNPGKWEPGTYTLTIFQECPVYPVSVEEGDEADVEGAGDADADEIAGVDGADESKGGESKSDDKGDKGDEGDENGKLDCSASTTFTIVGAEEEKEEEPKEELANTGAADLFGIAGLGLLGVAAGAGVLVARRVARKA